MTDSHWKRFACGVAVCGFLTGTDVLAQACPTANCIVTGGPKGTYFHMGGDLKRHVAPALSVLASSGSYDNLQRLASEPGVSFALVQADVLAYVDQLIKDEPDAVRAAGMRRLIAPLQVMLPLHEEELHVLVHKDSKLKYLHEIEGQRIFMGRVNSGSYITGRQVYKLLYGKALGVNEVAAQHFNKGSAGEEIDAALMHLGKLVPVNPETAVDVVMLVGGQPYAQIRNLENSQQVAGQFRFLALDHQHPATARLLERYRSTSLKADHYPEMSKGKDATATLGVPAYLVTSAFSDPRRSRFITQFASAYCKNFSSMVLDPASHAKWRAALWTPGQAAPSFVPGWRSASAEVTAALVGCRTLPKPAKPEPKPSSVAGCSPSPKDPTQCVKQ